MTVVDELVKPASADEPSPPLLEFLDEARFPEELRRRVRGAVRLFPEMGGLTNITSLLDHLRFRGGQQLADDLTHAVAAAARRYYPQKVRRPLFVILENADNPCGPEIFAEIFSDNRDPMGLVRALACTDTHVMEAVRLRDLWLIN